MELPGFSWVSVKETHVCLSELKMTLYRFSIIVRAVYVCELYNGRRIMMKLLNIKIHFIDYSASNTQNNYSTIVFLPYVSLVAGRVTRIFRKTKKDQLPLSQFLH